MARLLNWGFDFYRAVALGSDGRSIELSRGNVSTVPMTYPPLQVGIGTVTLSPDRGPAVQKSCVREYAPY